MFRVDQLSATAIIVCNVSISSFQKMHKMRHNSGSVSARSSAKFHLTNSMEPSPNWEVDSRSAAQELPEIVWNPKLHYHVYKTPTQIPIMCQFIPLHPVPLSSISILFYHLFLSLPSGLFPSAFPTKTLYVFLFPPCVPYALPISSSLTLSLAECTRYEFPHKLHLSNY
jgi:hypothetical protein